MGISGRIGRGRLITASTRCERVRFRQSLTRKGPPCPGMTMSAAASTRSRPRSSAAWSEASGSTSGERSGPHHRCVMA